MCKTAFLRTLLHPLTPYTSMHMLLHQLNSAIKKLRGRCVVGDIWGQLEMEMGVDMFTFHCAHV